MRGILPGLVQYLTDEYKTFLHIARVLKTLGILLLEAMREQEEYRTGISLLQEVFRRNAFSKLIQPRNSLAVTKGFKSQAAVRF
jgi:hypothetical protein